MANVLRGRGMSCALALWSAYIVVWTVVTEPGPVQAAGWWLAGTACAMALRPASGSSSAQCSSAPAVVPEGSGPMPDPATVPERVGL